MKSDLSIVKSLFLPHEPPRQLGLEKHENTSQPLIKLHCYQPTAHRNSWQADLAIDTSQRSINLIKS